MKLSCLICLPDWLFIDYQATHVVALGNASIHINLEFATARNPAQTFLQQTLGDEAYRAICLAPPTKWATFQRIDDPISTFFVYVRDLIGELIEDVCHRREANLELGVEWQHLKCKVAYTRQRAQNHVTRLQRSHGQHGALDHAHHAGHTSLPTLH